MPAAIRAHAIGATMRASFAVVFMHLPSVAFASSILSTLPFFLAGISPEVLAIGLWRMDQRDGTDALS
jgi:hypothetical protein